MRKVSLFALITVMLLTVAGCGGKETKVDNNPTITEPPVVTQEPTQAPGPTEEPQATPGETVVVPVGPGEDDVDTPSIWDDTSVEPTKEPEDKKDDDVDVTFEDLWNKYFPSVTPTPEITEPPVDVEVTPTVSPTPQIAAVSVTNMNFPSKVYKGNSFGLKGTVTSTEGDFVGVKGTILDAEGKVVMEAVEEFVGSSYEIQPGKVNHDLIFGDLAVGKYVYRLSVLGEAYGEFIVAEHDFEIVEKPKTTKAPTPTPKPTQKPSSGDSSGGDEDKTDVSDAKKETKYGNSGKVDTTYENKNITVTVTVGTDGLTGSNSRKAVLIGSAAAKLLGDEYKSITENGWQWAVVHVKVKINSSDGVGNYNDCMPDIIIRSQNGSKLNGSDIPYYVLTLDKNGFAYNNATSYEKYYDVAFQIPSGVSSFDITFGNSGNILVYEHK